MHVRPDNPLIVQGDGKVLLETKHKKYEEVRDFLSRFAEIETSPEHLHTYRIHPLSLWNAASSGLKRDEIIDGLRGFSKFDVPPDVLARVSETMDRYGLVKLVEHPSDPALLRLEFATSYIAKVVGGLKSVKDVLIPDGTRYFAVTGGHRGVFKQRMLNEGWPVEDLAGFLPGDPMPFELRETMGNGKPFVVRDYQRTSADRWFQEGRPSGGHGVIVLPCGAGKTIVAIQAMQKVQQHTLILATNGAAVQQWVREILDKTTLTKDDVGAYTGETKEIRPVTVATYQILTWRASKEQEFAHLHLFRDRNWGMLVYDEVHLLPAPVFGATADVQARRRLGLTATLVREDGREGDVFSLVGPRRYDMAWQTLEERGFIAEARCFEVRVDFKDAAARKKYEDASELNKTQVATANPQKLPALDALLKKHAKDNVLVIGTYLEQLIEIARRYNAALITGKTPARERELLFQKFRDGRLKLLIVSKVANFSIDLPDANVAIQISGSYGSRQEEAQRLGRVLRPKKDGAWFYSIVTRETKEQEFAMKRQLFLTEQGYRYYIQEAGQPAVAT